MDLKRYEINSKTEKMEEIRQLIVSGNKMDNPQMIFINSDEKGGFVVYPEDSHKDLTTIIIMAGFSLNEVNKLIETYPDVKVIWFLNNPKPEEDYKGQEPEHWSISRLIKKGINHSTHKLLSSGALFKQGILLGFIEKNGRKDLSVKFIKPQP